MGADQVHRGRNYTAGLPVQLLVQRARADRRPAEQRFASACEAEAANHPADFKGHAFDGGLTKCKFNNRLLLSAH